MWGGGSGGSCACLGAGVCGKISVPYTQFYCEAKNALKSGSLFQKGWGGEYEGTLDHKNVFLTILLSSFWIWISLYQVYSKNTEQAVLKMVTTYN